MRGRTVRRCALQTHAESSRGSALPFTWRSLQRSRRSIGFINFDTNLEAYVDADGGVLSVPLLVAFLGLCVLAACGEERDPVDRVQPNAIAKTYFDGEW